MSEFYDFDGGPYDGSEAYYGDNPPKTKTVSDFGCKHKYKLTLKDGEYVYAYVKTIPDCTNPS